MDINHRLWEERYKQSRDIARYPYEQIVSKVFQLSNSKKMSDLRAFDFGYGGGNHLWMLKKENSSSAGRQYRSLSFNSTELPAVEPN